MFYLCKEFHTLPYPGGMLDQPFRIVALFEMIQTAVYEREQRVSKKQEQEAKRASKRA